jgi:hypothetical protein
LGQVGSVQAKELLILFIRAQIRKLSITYNILIEAPVVQYT